MDVFIAFCLSRCTLLLVAEVDILDHGSLGRFIQITLPFLFTIAQVSHAFFGVVLINGQLVFIHDRMVSKHDLVHFIYAAVRIGLIFGLAMCAPSSFVTSSN